MACSSSTQAPPTPRPADPSPLADASTGTIATSAPTPIASAPERPKDEGPPFVVPGPFAELFADGKSSKFSVTEKPKSGPARTFSVDCRVRRTLATPNAVAACLECAGFEPRSHGAIPMCFLATTMGLWRTITAVEEAWQVDDDMKRPPYAPVSLASYDLDFTPEESGDLESYKVKGGPARDPSKGYCVDERIEMGGPFDDTTERWCIAAASGLSDREYVNITEGRRMVMRPEATR